MSDKIKEEVSRNIIENSYYLIILFDEDKSKRANISITNLKLQKLMYFVEAYYMVKNPEERNLFDSQWSAWDYGPVNKDLYNHFKKFGSMEISLLADEMSIGECLPETNKKYIKKIYDLFGNFTAFDLVTLTHMKGSPWDKIYRSNNISKKYKFDKLNDSIISKEETKEWFETTFPFLFSDGKEA